MTNPVSKFTNVSLPPMTQPFVDPATGQIVLPWYQAFLSLVVKSGGTSGLDLSSIAQDAASALSLARSATNATSLNTSQITAITAATGQAQLIANQANQKATSALSGLVNVLVRSQNLADVASVVDTRRNLGVNQVPLMVTVDDFVTFTRRYIPLTQKYILPQNFGGTRTYAGTPPLADSTFDIGFMRGAVFTPIGTIMLVNGGQFSTMTCAQTSLSAGDVLVVDWTGMTDANLENLSISFLMSLA